MRPPISPLPTSTPPLFPPPTSLPSLGRSPAASPVGAGLVHRIEPGVSRHWLESMRRDGSLVGVGPDHYLLAEAADWPTARRLVLVALMPPGSIASLGTAVWARGGPAPRHPPGQPIPVEITVDPHSWQQPQPFLRVFRTRIPEQDVDHLQGVAVTSAVRTLTDLVLTGRPHHATALTWLLAQPEVTLAGAHEMLARRGSVRHLRRARKVLALLADEHPNPLAEVDRH